MRFHKIGATKKKNAELDSFSFRVSFTLVDIKAALRVVVEDPYQKKNVIY